jgi:hypothetical protein
MSSWKGTNLLHTHSPLFWIQEEVSVCCSPCWKPHSDIPRVYSTQIAHVGSLNMLQSSAAGMRRSLHLGHSRPSTVGLWYISTFKASVCTIIIVAHTAESKAEVKSWLDLGTEDSMICCRSSSQPQLRRVMKAKPKKLHKNLKASDTSNSLQLPESLGFWTLPIVRNSKY